jgi:hypothetical protein
MSAKILKQIFKKVYRKPSWHVRRVYGSIIAFEFGKPKLEVLKKVFYPNKKTIRKYPRRTATVRGEWGLTIYCCDWEIRQGNQKIGSSKSRANKIDQVCAILDGQMLTKITVDPKTLRTEFHFDLGGHLQTIPWKKETKSFEMWWLRCSNRHYFSLRSDGKYSYNLSTPPDEKKWLQFQL